MALGETGNFTSCVLTHPLIPFIPRTADASFVYRYAFAPASIVAPLGTTALIANCFIAPCLLHEKFRKKDLLGIALSIVGALAVVLSGRSENKSVSCAIAAVGPQRADETPILQLSPSEFLHAIAQPAFIVYSSISVGLIA